MKRQNIILSLFLTLGLVAIISIYIANQSLNETLRKVEEEKVRLQFQGRSRQGLAYPMAAKRRRKPVETKSKQEVKKIPSPELEFDLEELPEDYVEGEVATDIESNETPGEEGSEETKLKKYPSADELKELKNKGVILY